MPLPEWTWPDWKSAPTGTRFIHNRTGQRGTLIRPAKGGRNGGIVVWDNRPFKVLSVVKDVEGAVFFVGIAREARPLTTEELWYENGT